MPSGKGCIALMGSGELTSTMVEVHKELLERVGRSRHAVFLDTPAGFQLNVDDLSQRALHYFVERVQHPMNVASFKSKKGVTAYEAERAFHLLRDSGYLLIGPGSPTYAVSQWQHTPIPEIFIHHVENGGCLVAASAAALTVGRFTLPVYEIYKVGQDLHWAEGLNLLEHFGLPLVVIPHWNNAEGGTHDTRFCYMGEPRFQALESLLPPDVSILGLDEHTACLLDLESGEATVRGIGQVTLRRNGLEISFARGEKFPIEVLQGGTEHRRWRRQDGAEAVSREEAPKSDDTFWIQVRNTEAIFERGEANRSPSDLVSALLELDSIVWKGQQDLENPEFVAQARERFRDLIVRLGSFLEGSVTDKSKWLAPLVETLLELRERYRHEKRWEDADALRESLHQAGVVVEDTPDGTRWRLEDAETH